ncbi:Uncharacterised protein [Vibrio cholerae]|nr:Uncharacterised protein [Vibrio cholerae]
MGAVGGSAGHPTSVAAQSHPIQTVVHRLKPAHYSTSLQAK